MSPRPGLVNAPADPVDEGELVDRRDHRLLVDELLDTLEHRLALGAVELVRLLAKEPVYVRIAAVGELPPEIT